MLANLVRRVEHIKSGIVTPEQDRQATHAARSLSEHVASYLEHMRAKTIRGRKVSKKHRVEVERQLKMIASDCGFTKLADISREAMEKWMNRQEKAGMGARTRNTYRAAILTFCNWCVETDRLRLSLVSRPDWTRLRSRRRPRSRLRASFLARLSE